MNITDIKNATKYIQSKFKCEACKKKYSQDDIYLMATAEHEGLFELRCTNCKTQIMITIVNVLKEQQFKFKQRILKNKIQGKNVISKNDILDLKNFLDKKFDGNFKKLFQKKS